MRTHLLETKGGVLSEGFKAGKRMRGQRSHSPSRAKKVLTLEEMERVESLVQDVFNYLTELRKRDDLATCIRYPKIPSDLSESAVIHLREKLFDGSRDARLGGNEGDVFVQYPNGQKRVEVKATGEHGFEALSKKDVSADYIVWVHFGTFFRKGGEVTLFRVKEPSGIFKEGTKISIGKFLQAIPQGKLTKLTAPSITQLVRKWMTDNLSA